jgi:hypothetical protein
MEGFLKQSTAVNVTVLMIDSSDHVTGKTGLAAGLTIYAVKAGTSGVITPTVTEVDSTNVKGVYKLALTTGHTDTLGELELHITASGADPTDLKWQVSSYLPGEAATLQADQAVNATKWAGGTIPAPNVTGVPLIDAKYLLGTIFATPATAGIPDVNMKNIANAAVSTTTAQIGVNAVQHGGTAQTGRDIGASVLLSAGTGTGQLDFTSGVVKANLAQILGTALTETAGQIAAAFKKFFNIATPAATMDHLVLVDTVTTATTATNLTNAPTAGDFTATMKTSLNAATPAVTVSDKTGFSLSAAGVQAIWDALTSALTTVGSVGKRIADFLTGDAYVRLGAPVGASISADIAAAPGKVWDITLASHLTSGTTGAALNAAGAAGDPWSTTLPGAYGAGTAGNIIGNRIDAAISTRTKPADTQAAVTSVTNDVGITQAAADKVWSSATRTLTSFGTLVADAATAVWGAATRLLTAGTNIVLAKGTGVTGFNDLDAAGVRSAVGLTSANLNTQLAAIDADVISTTGAVNTTVLAVKAKTDNLPASPAAVSDIPTAAQSADKLLGRSLAGGADGGRTVQDALRALRNKASIAGGVLTITEEDDSTPAWTATVATTPGDPITLIDPA